MKFLGINLTKYVRVCIKKPKETMTEEIKGVPNKWRDYPCLWIRRQYNIIKCQLFPI